MTLSDLASASWYLRHWQSCSKFHITAMVHEAKKHECVSTEENSALSEVQASHTPPYSWILLGQNIRNRHMTYAVRRTSWYTPPLYFLQILQIRPDPALTLCSMLYTRKSFTWMLWYRWSMCYEGRCCGRKYSETQQSWSFTCLWPRSFLYFN